MRVCDQKLGGSGKLFFEEFLPRRLVKGRRDASFYETVPETSWCDMDSVLTTELDAVFEFGDYGTSAIAFLFDANEVFHRLA